jgi:hypothetical protein
MKGWVKVHRKLSEKVFYRKDSEKVHLWIHLLICANRDEREELLGGKLIKCNSGQFTTGRKQLSEATGINESKIERILTYFEKIEQQIEQQKTSTNRLISILNWSEYQLTEQQSEQRVNNERTTSEHTTRSKEVKEEEKKVIIEKIQKDFYQSLTPFVKEFGRDTLREFYEYWSEPNKSKTKIKFQLEKTWDTRLRLLRWVKNDFGKKKIEQATTKSSDLTKLYKKID